MDVTPDEVVHVMDKYGVELMIHGHTHRPAIHQVNDGSQKTRIVLGDWYTQGSVLVYSNNGYSLENRRFESQL